MIITLISDTEKYKDKKLLKTAIPHNLMKLQL